MKKQKQLITPRLKITVPIGDKTITVALDEIVYLKAENRDSLLHLTSGTVLKVSRALHRIEKQLKKYPNFSKPTKSYIINLDNLDAYEYERSTKLVFKIQGETTKVPATPRYQKPIKKYFNVRTLKNIIPDDSIARILRYERIKTYDRDITRFSKEEAIKEFGSYTSKKIQKTIYVKNMVWQIYNQIISGKRPLMEGNIRSIWYKPILTTFSNLKIKDDDDDKIINKVLEELIVDYKLFKYADLGLADNSKHYWKIGDKNPHVIIFAEKKGHLNTLEKIYDQSGVTYICLGGQPSHLTSEYFVAALLKKIDESSFIDPEKNVDIYEDPTFYIYSVVDWDPSGYYIRKNFLEQITKQGITKMKVIDLITLKTFKPSELDYVKYRLKTPNAAERTKNRTWVKLTGGVKGEHYGIECDALDRYDLRKLFFEKAAVHFRKVTPSSLAMISDTRILDKIAGLNLIPADQQTAYV